MPSGLSLPPHSLLSGSFGSSPLLPPLGNLGPQSQTQGAPQAAKAPTSLAHRPPCLAVWLLSAVPTPSVCWQRTEAGPCLPPITSFRFLRCRGSRKDKFNFLEPPSNFFWKLLPFFGWGEGGRNEEVNNNIARFLSKLATCSHWELAFWFQRTQALQWDASALKTQLHLLQPCDLEQVTFPLCAACFFLCKIGIVSISRNGCEDPTRCCRHS